MRSVRIGFGFFVARQHIVDRALPGREEIEVAEFLGELHRTLEKLLEFWPGLDKTFYIGCPTKLKDGSFCKGQFKLDFIVRQDKKAPDQPHTCQDCENDYTPRELLLGYRVIEEPQGLPAALAMDIAARQAHCPRTFTLVPADRGRYDPRQYMPGKLAGQRLCLTLLSEHSFKPIISKEFGVPPGWVKWIGPLARIGSLALTGTAVPFAGTAAGGEFEFAAKFMGELGGVGGEDPAIRRHLKAGDGEATMAWPSGADLEHLHNLLKEIGLAPDFGGMQFVKIRHKGFLWVSKEEAEAHAEEVPTLAYIPRNG